MPSSNMYAELLLNLQQVTVFASLKSSLNENTSLYLSPDLETLSLRHEGETARLRLPTKVAANATLKLPAAPVTELSFRLPLSADVKPAKRNDAAANNDVPWSAGALTPTTRISCRSCNETLVEQSAIATWKDLPSENWAEMMDFWHCHKPDHEGNDEMYDHSDAANGSQKGYTATSKLLAKSGVGFVDLCYFLLAKQDCSGIQVHESKSRRPPKLKCSACHEPIGSIDEKAEGWRLFKWSLRVQLDPQDYGQTFPVEMFVSAQLLELVENQAIRKFVVRDEDGGDGAAAIIFWVFTPDLRYSTLAQSGHSQRALKILYQHIENSQDLLEKQSISLEGLYLPAHVLESISRSLLESTALLPVSARKIQGWAVGLLDRFDSGS